jgi:hypothetical protein
VAFAPTSDGHGTTRESSGTADSLNSNRDIAQDDIFQYQAVGGCDCAVRGPAGYDANGCIGDTAVQNCDRRNT